MPKRSLIEQLNEAVQTMLARPDAKRVQSPDPELAPLLRVARDLRELPHEDFKTRLKSDLKRRVTMASATPVGGKVSSKEESKQTGYIREGFHTITPYLIVAGAAQFIEFLKEAFDGTERLRVPAPGGKIMHAEVAVGDSIIELADANDQYPPAPTAIHLYVPDADSTYERALRAGATPISASENKPYGERGAGVRDPFGNSWFIATYGTGAKT